MNTCPACNKATRTRFLFENRDLLHCIDDKRFRLVRCEECFLVSLDPQPSFEELKKYYPESYEPFTDNKPFRLIKKFLRLRSYFFAKKLKKLKGLEARILEIGSANGENLLGLRSFGFQNVEGIEPSQSAAVTAAKKGLTVRCESFQSIKTDKTYDVIIMRHVLEHLPDPVSVFNKLAELLRNGGFVFIDTPNYASLDRLLLGKYWSGYDTPRHLYIYSPSNMRKLLKDSPFNVTGIQHSIVPNQWVESFKLYFNSKNRMTLAKFFSIYNILLLALFAPINILQSILSVSGRMKITLIKK